MKRFVISFMAFLLLVYAAYTARNLYIEAKAEQNAQVGADGVRYVSRVDDEYFYLYDDGHFERTFLKGVNLGVGKPGYFPGEYGITKEEYLRWFGLIKKMNANVIRVYITQNPAFYDALYEYNWNNPDPLYVIHGVWVRDDLMTDCESAFSDDGYFKNSFLADALQTIDVIHGNQTTTPDDDNDANDAAAYDKDVSRYVIGWILGVEWEPNFVVRTNETHPEKQSYDGRYLYTENASPFEVFWCEIGDEVIRYETETYQMQRPLAITNWSTTDPLDQPNEPLEQERLVSLDMEHLRAKDEFHPGLFASYHVYPYYPDYMNYETKYIGDDPDDVNTYQAYLKELRAHHAMPVLVAEVGLPTSRGVTHESRFSGYNQGGLTEEEQGRMLVSMVGDVKSESYAGVLIFTWQDEWFKRTWNTMDYNTPDRRAYWGDAQTCEQHFGLLSFDPGTEDSALYVDGDVGEWDERHVIHEDDGFTIYSQYDAKYLYLRIEKNRIGANQTAGSQNEGDYDWERDELLLPLDVIDDQGNEGYGGHTFERAADFLIRLRGRDDSRILVDPYYHPFYASYPEVPVPNASAGIERQTKNTGLFDDIYLALNKELYLPDTKETIPFSYFNASTLRHGNANPDSVDYDSLADCIYSEGNWEVRIPWALLNVADPSSKQMLADLHTVGSDGFTYTRAKQWHIGVTRGGSPRDGVVAMSGFTWEKWDHPTYHERLKRSYYIVKDAFEGL